MEDLDWRWLRSFIAVAESTSMHKAAERSGISQATLSRHVRQLEESLDTSLFDRDRRGITLSERGTSLLERALVVRDAVGAFERQAAGISEETSGMVRVTMSNGFGLGFAPGWLASLQETHPATSVDLVLEDEAADLLLRKAEIAVRMFRPQQLDLVMKRCGETRLGFFASEAYIAKRGRPQTLEDLHSHQLVGYDRRTMWIERARAMGFDYARDDFATRCDAEVFHMLAAREGIGIAVLPVHVGERDQLVKLFGPFTMPGQPIYLVAHSELYRNKRVANVWNHLAAELTSMFGDGANDTH